MPNVWVCPVPSTFRANSTSMSWRRIQAPSQFQGPPWHPALGQLTGATGIRDARTSLCFPDPEAAPILPEVTPQLEAQKKKNSGKSWNFHPDPEILLGEAPPNRTCCPCCQHCLPGGGRSQTQVSPGGRRAELGSVTRGHHSAGSGRAATFSWHIPTPPPTLAHPKSSPRHTGPSRAASATCDVTSSAQAFLQQPRFQLSNKKKNNTKPYQGKKKHKKKDQKKDKKKRHLLFLALKAVLLTRITMLFWSSQRHPRHQ